MKKQGTVVRWDNARGFGFIRSPGPGADIFFHARDFRHMAPPHEGLSVTFEEIHAGGKGPRAMAVQPSVRMPDRDATAASVSRHERTQKHSAETTKSARRTQTFRRNGQFRTTGKGNTTGASTAWALLLMLGWLLLLVWGISVRRLPLWLPGPVLLLNLLTVYAYWTDKYAAQKGRWRIRENTLHGLGLLGGWPGAWLAHQILRHKSRKQAFRSSYWLTVALHFIALAAWLFWLPPQQLLHNP